MSANKINRRRKFKLEHILEKKYLKSQRELKMNKEYIARKCKEIDSKRNK